jgi:hypothetical protein
MELRKRQFHLSAYFRLFAANGNGKLKFVFLGQQTITGNQRLLFQQTCPSMLTPGGGGGGVQQPKQ